MLILIIMRDVLDFKQWTIRVLAISKFRSVRGQLKDPK